MALEEKTHHVWGNHILHSWILTSLGLDAYVLGMLCFFMLINKSLGQLSMYHCKCVQLSIYHWNVAISLKVILLRFADLSFVEAPLVFSFSSTASTTTMPGQTCQASCKHPSSSATWPVSATVFSSCWELLVSVHRCYLCDIFTVPSSASNLHQSGDIRHGYYPGSSREANRQRLLLNFVSKQVACPQYEPLLKLHYRASSITNDDVMCRTD